MLANSFQSDELDSDELDGVLDISLAEYRVIQNGSNAEAGPSRTSEQPPTYLQKQQLGSRLSALDVEIRDVEKDIENLKTLRENLLAQRREVAAELQKTQTASVQAFDAKSKVSRKPRSSIDYDTEFEWSGSLKARMKTVFGINNFRLCQEGVCNANMDGRDIVCVMPTGGGKSLTYQLPALLVPGCTLVVSPLISLITDQIIHLREAGVEAVMLTGSTNKGEARNIQSRLTAMALGRGSDTPEIKLCYVTPEKLAKSQLFMSLVEKLYNANKLARIVIDEAHCVSQMGHDYRPDYQKLNILRKMFPRVPILALSATCPPKVLKDLMMILRMRQPLQNGASASTEGTVYFSAPLYRRNLHYRVLLKPSKHTDTIEAMKSYILENHRGHSGIIYCLSRKDAEIVAKELYDAEKIRTGVYHAEVGDKEKENMHIRWRKGDVNVVCATTAFGLGIDKADVRFVLHHTMPKSLEGFYQESGRAGRDGNDADCVLYYRPQDATRLAQLTVGELGSQEKLHEMLRFAQDMDECRSVQFAKYFSSSSQLSVNSWATQEKDALQRCGHCDNCTRLPDSFSRRDVRLPAWQLLRVADAARRNSGRLTIGQLCDLARGLGGATFDVSGKGKGKSRAKEKQRAELNLDEIAGGKVELSKEDTETLCVHLLVNDYLQEDFHPTAYTTNVYVIPGPNALRLSRMSRIDMEQGKGPSLECSFPNKPKRKGASQKSPRKKAQAEQGECSELGSSSRPRKRALPSYDERDEDITLTNHERNDHNLKDMYGDPEDDEFDLQDEVEDADDWNFSLRGRSTQPSRKKPRTTTRRSSKLARSGDDVISISSD